MLFAIFSAVGTAAESTLQLASSSGSSGMKLMLTRALRSTFSAVFDAERITSTMRWPSLVTCGKHRLYGARLTAPSAPRVASSTTGIGKYADAWKNRGRSGTVTNGSGAVVACRGAPGEAAL